MPHPLSTCHGAPFRAVGILSTLAALVALSGCAAAAITTGAVAVAGAGIGAVAKVAGAGIDAVVPDLSDYSGKWRIECSGGADSDGRVVLHITPKGEPHQEVTVAIAKGTGENAVARAIRDALKAQLDSKRFHVEIDDGEDVLIKKRGRTPDIALQVAGNTVAGVRLNPDRE
jgi:hypothetical protein